MTDIILSSFLSLFALFGKEEGVDESRARRMLVSYLRHHFGIRNTGGYVDFYSDMLSAYELRDDLDENAVVASICDNLQGKIRKEEGWMLLLRIMEFCGTNTNHPMFKTMAEKFDVPEKLFNDYVDFVEGKESENVLILRPDGFAGELKTLQIEEKGGEKLVFTYNGSDRVLLNDVPVLPGAYQVWLQSSVLKGVSGKPFYYSSVMAEYSRRAKNGEHSEENRVVFCGRDLEYRFPGSDNGLHNMSFTLHGGELTAIMGGSGTGKSTLLSILNGSLKPDEGSLTMNGVTIVTAQGGMENEGVKDLIGYVPQDDLLIEELTVYQNLYYTAKLCFASLSEEEIEERVMRTLRDLDLEGAKDLKVGSAINKFISGGQRKRLNIALELIREPLVLFLDEPTSGLSSSDTERLMNLLKEQTCRGRLIVLTIHQPSSDVYKLFDRLWLLDRGGYPVFDGNPIDAITYFKEAAGYADAETSACPTCGNVNPEIMLNIIEERLISSGGETSDERKMSPQEWHELYLKRRPAPQPLTTKDEGISNFSKLKKPSKLEQFFIFLKRNLKTKVTNFQYLSIALLEAPVLAVICGLLTRYAPNEGYSVMENKNLVSYLFMSVIVATFIGMSGSAEEIIKDRALLKREKFLHLSYGSYIWSKIVLMAGVSLIQTFLFIVIGNYIMGIHGLFGTWWLILFVTAFLANLTGLLLSQCLNSIVAIYISIPLLLIPQILLCGLVVSFSDLTPKSTTGNVPLIGDLIPSRWSYEALAVTSYTDNAYEKPFFEMDKARQENQFYNVGFLKELQSQLETKRDEEEHGKPVNPAHMRVIRTNLPILTSFCEIEPYTGGGDYESLNEYMKKAESILAKRGNEWTLKKDTMVAGFVNRHGKEWFLDLKRNNYNLKLEEFVTGATEGRLYDIVDDHIVPHSGIIYLTPYNKMGRAPFYSSEKILGSWHVKTLWFNIGVLLLMAVIATVLLLTDCPGRFMRKDN